MKTAHLFDFVDNHALHTPEAPALRDTEHRYSYEEVSRLSHNFAYQIQKLGDVIGKNIGLLYDQSAQSIILMLAIMKAGGVYVPLNRTLPEERLHRMIEEADIAIILSPTVHDAIAGRTISVLPEEVPPHQLPEKTYDLAYAIFTSGSTGFPKLALLSHGAVRHVMTRLTKRYHITPEDRVLQFANLSFDGSISEIFGAFVAGAELVIPTTRVSQSITNLSHFINDQVITVAILPPSLVMHLPLDAQHLKTLVVAGEPCPASLAQKAVSQVPHFINAYGPTECAICVSTYEVPTHFDGPLTPIGTPLPDVATLILNEEGEEISDGEVGELYVGGQNLFNGYYKDPSKTSGVLVTIDGKGIYYRTGDYVTRKNDIITYVSRRDDYIKYHGLRISPLEVEEAIQQKNRAIRGAAVVVSANPSDGQLVAYYEAAEELPEKEIADSIRQLLPAYAIPQTFIWLEHLPLTPNQKIDRRALTDRTLPPQQMIEPTDDDIQTIWQSILGMSVDDSTDFFLSGGDSLRAMRLLAEVDTQYKTNLSLTGLYSHSTLGSFRNFVKTQPRSSMVSALDQSDLTPYEAMLWSASAHAGNAATYTLTEILEPDFVVDSHRLRLAVSTLSTRFTAASYFYIMGENGLEKQPSNTIGLIDYGDCLEEAWNGHIQTLRNQPIDMAKDPLVTLYSAVVNQQSRILIHAHHLILSAGIVGTFVRELWDCYQQTDKNTVIAAQNIPRFTDADKAFWQKAYAADTEYVQLPWVGTRTAKPRNNGSTLSIDLPIANHVIKKLGVTNFVFYRAVFALVLHRLTEQKAFYIGSSVDLLPNASLGSQAAMLNTLPILSQLEESQTFEDFLQSTQHVVRDALDHRFMPLHDIIKLHPFEQDRLIGPFNVLFDYIEKANEYIIPGLGTIKTAQLFNDTSKYDLTLTISEASTTRLDWEYDTDLLDIETVQQIAAIFSHVCAVILKDVHANIKDITLLDTKETTRMLSIGKGPTQKYSKESFYDRFLSQVQAHPESAAIRHDGKVTSYRDLHYLVDHYSKILIDQQLPLETPVGVLMERTVEMIASIIALWRLGYTYVPIEPNLPTHRIQTVIHNAHIPLIFTHSHLRDKLPPSLTIIDEHYQAKANDIHPVAVPSNLLAYIIFTSGSTGTPKGVMIEHGSMLNHADAMIDYLHLDHTSSIAQTASHSFDISVWQLTTLLTIGGAIVIYSKDDQADLESFTEKLLTDEVTVLELVPSYISILLEYLDDTGHHDRLQNIRHLISTGENIAWPLIERWTTNMPTTQLINAYGPAEASDDTNLFTFTNTPNINQRGLPIGKTLPNIDVFILDENYNPRPLGIQGEIFIAGIAIARGYVNDTERTRQSFVTNPHTGQLMYKTGDLGYWSPSGDLMYIGRTDFQLKIRGFRIELEEIEAHIIRHPDVVSVAVVATERNNSKQLHAYITADHTIDSDALMGFLREQLPEYMVPSSITQLSTLPLNNSGKIDRTLLANKERLRFKENEAVVQTSPEEDIVIGIWREVFNVDSITATDDYYALGGDSITSFRIFAKLTAKGYHVNLQDILALPILRDFARTMTPLTTKQYSQRIEGAFSHTPIQARFMAHHTDEVMAQNITINGNWNQERLERAIIASTKKHGAFYLSISQADQSYELSPQVRTGYTFVEKSIDDTLAFDRLFQELSNGALLAYGATGENQTITTLYLAANHLVVDVVSWSIYLETLLECYDKDAANEDIDYTFGAWAQALQNAANPADSSLTYWKGILAKTEHATEVINEYFDNVTPTTQVVTRQVPAITNLHEATIYSSIIKATCEVIGHPGTGILIETQGRYGEALSIDLSQTVGWFTHLLPVIGTSQEEVRTILNLDEQIKRDYGLGVQRQLIPYASEPRIVVNYLGKLQSSTLYELRRTKHEIPTGNELMELSLYEKDTDMFIELCLYATPKKSDFAARFLDAISKQLSKPAVALDDNRMQALLARLGASHE